MNRSKSTDSQIIDASKRVEAGYAVLNIYREQGIQHGDVLQVACHICYDGCIDDIEHVLAGRQKPAAQQDVPQSWTRCRNLVRLGIEGVDNFCRKNQCAECM